MNSRRLGVILAAVLLCVPLAASAAGGRAALPLSPEEGRPQKALEPPPSAALLSAAKPAAEKAAGYPPLSCGYYEEEAFLRSVNGIEPYPVDGDLRAGVVPHHLLAGRMIAAFFARAAQNEQPYESVILVGPSHYPTKNRLTTAYGGWETPFGTLENNRQFTCRLVENGRIAAAADEAAVEGDHAISGLIPYVKYYLPKASVSAVLVQNTAEASRVQALAQEIAEFLREERALLICSIDFSHYLMPEAVARRDAQTRRALEDYDYTAVSHFTDSNVDSPPALTVFMKNAEPYGPVQFLDHSSSDRILALPLGDPIYREGTTSYFILGAVDGE